MPVHPSEEEAPSNIYEKVAKDPSSNTESTASDHSSHHNEHTPSAEHFQSKGPQIPMRMSDMPPTEGTKEERRKKAEEMNK